MCEVDKDIAVVRTIRRQDLAGLYLSESMHKLSVD